MKFLNLGSISKKLSLLVILAILPGLTILFYSGLEQRQQSIETAKRDVLLLTQAMAEVQFDMTNSTRQILSTLSLLPEITTLNIQASSEIFKAVLEQNPNYNNIVLTDLNGEVLTSGKTFAGTNLADRKHIQEVLIRQTFTVGEFIISRGGDLRPIFPFAYPVFDKNGKLKAVLTTAVNLTSFSRFHDFSSLPEKSFVGITDHKGIRIFYYPSQEKTNPVGTPISPRSWAIASQAQDPGIFISAGSDGLRRIFAFEQVRLTPEDIPYLYVWAGVPEAHILAPANEAMKRNLLLMLLATCMSLLITWVIGRKTLIGPVQRLVVLTQKFSQGDFEARSDLKAKAGEFGLLTKAFHDMSDALTVTQRTLRENEARFRLLMDSLDAIVYVADMSTHKVLFINKYGMKLFGDVTGKICWQSLQCGQSGPCSFCTYKYLLDREGKPGEVCSSELQNPVSGQWLHRQYRAIEWTDGRIVRLQVATDITDRKQAEIEREQLIVQLKNALAKVKTLSGFLPICASCKMIRDDKGYWNQIESYIRDHSDAEFSHGICPDCVKKLYPTWLTMKGISYNRDAKITYFITYRGQLGKTTID